MRYGSEYVVSRQGTADALKRKFAYWLDGHGIFDRHEDARTNQNLTGLGFVAKPGCDIGYRPDRGIVEASLEADGAQGGKSVGDADAEANVVSQPTRKLFFEVAPIVLRERTGSPIL